MRSASGPSHTTSPVAEEIERCVDELVVRVSPATLERWAPVYARLNRFAVSAGCTQLSDVTPAVMEDFLKARLPNGRPATAPTIHNRRTAVRTLFRAARRLGLADGDPTLDAQLPAKGALAARPLTEDEVARARDASRWSLTSQRFAAAWALAETSARVSELPGICWEHVDISTGAVALPGNGRVRTRTGRLTGWGLDVLTAVREQNGPLAVPIVVSVDGSQDSRRVSVSNTISAVLIRSGLAARRGVRPGSIAAWAGKRHMETTGDIAAVARLLGVSSLDVAARMIAWDWNQT